jgi:OmpA-OmpF porin, OOP family
MKKHVLALGLVAAAAVPVSADGLYVFGDIGQGTYEVKSKSYSDNSATGTGFAFGAGYSVNDTFSFEGGYRHSGRFELDSRNSSDLDISISAVEIAGVAKYPVATSVNVYGRLGFANWTTETRSEIFYDYSESTNKAFAGIGVSFEVSEHASLRAEYVRSEKFNDATVSRASFGAVYSF